MVVAARAMNGGADEGRHHRGDHVVTVEVLRDLLVDCTVGDAHLRTLVPRPGRQKTNAPGRGWVVREKYIAGHLLAHEPGVRLVVVERLDEPVAVRPGVFADGILVVAVRLRIVGDVHPVPGPAFAVARTREQSVDQPLGRAGGVVVDECADFRRGGREPGEVEGRTPDERLPVGGRGRPEVFFGVFRRDKTVDRVSGPAGLEVSRLWYRGARQRLDRPPQIVGGRLIG